MIKNRVLSRKRKQTDNLTTGQEAKDSMQLSERRAVKRRKTETKNQKKKNGRSQFYTTHEREQIKNKNFSEEGNGQRRGNAGTNPRTNSPHKTLWWRSVIGSA
jgi:hypothetical protein